MPYIPINYDNINLMAGSTNPSTVKSYNNRTFAFWERSLFQRAASTVKFDDLPEGWRGSVHDFLYYCLFKFGFVAAFKTNELGNVFQPCSLSGYNFWYQPTTALIANPTLTQSLELEIGKDCELIKLTPDYMGVWDIISYYAETLSLLDNAINMSLINSKFSLILGAKNKSAATALKEILDKVNKGEPAVIYDRRIEDTAKGTDTPFQIIDFGNIKEKYLTTDQLNDFNTLINNFDAEVGIPTIPNEKKERMVTSEADSRKVDSMSRSVIWLETLTESLIGVNSLLGTDIKVSLRYAEDETEPVEEEMEGEEEIIDE